MNKDYLLIKRTGINVETDVPHLITQAKSIHDAPEFRLGYIGTGPRELAANVLWYSNVKEESDCFKNAARFQADVLDQKINSNGQLMKKDIEDWLEANKISYKKFGN